MTFQLFPLHAYQDNYIWVFKNQFDELIIVDPGESTPVLEYLQTNAHHRLSGILITHKHWDHCNGVPEILENYHVPVYGPHSNDIAFISHSVKEKDIINIKGFPEFTVMEIPGHTLEHIAYHTHEILFCGDTLFTAGCGRIFEGTPSQMLQTLKKIASLPDEILIYCGHEYTLNNLKFAQCVEPHNPDLAFRIKTCEQLRQGKKPTVPFTLQLEKLTNPFLRCQIPTVVTAIEKHYQKKFDHEIDVFAHLRQWKDGFQA